MRRPAVLLCVAWIAFLPVCASAEAAEDAAKDSNWKNLARWLADVGCEMAAPKAGKIISENLEILGHIAGHYGCSWAVEKYLGSAPHVELPLKIPERCNRDLIGECVPSVLFPHPRVPNGEK